MVKVIDFKGSSKIIKDKGLHDYLIAFLESLDQSPRTVSQINRSIKSHLQSKGYLSPKWLEYPYNVRFQHDFFKNRIAIEVELSFQNKVFHELTRLDLAFRSKKIAAGVLITNRTLDNIDSRSKEAYATFEQTQKWVRLCYDLELYQVPLLLIGIR